MEVKIDLEVLALNNLTPNEFTVLHSIANGSEYVWLSNTREDKAILDTILKSLEDNLFIKVLDDTIELRSKAISLGLGEKDYSDDIREVLAYLNKKLGVEGRKGFKATTKGHAAPIRARLKEGYITKDLKGVVNEMYKRWYGGNMEGYLRPQTLFNATKFSGYLVLVKEEKKSNVNEML